MAGLEVVWKDEEDDFRIGILNKAAQFAAEGNEIVPQNTTRPSHMYLEVGFNNILQAIAELAIGANIEQQCTLPFHGAFSRPQFPLARRTFNCRY